MLLGVINQKRNFLSLEDRNNFFQLMVLQEKIHLPAAAFFQSNFQLHRQRFIRQGDFPDHCMRDFAQRIESIDFGDFPAGQHGIELMLDTEARQHFQLLRHFLNVGRGFLCQLMQMGLNLIWMGQKDLGLRAIID